MQRRHFLTHLALLLAIFLWVVSPALVDARPGGGSRSSVSRSSGSSSRSSSSSSRSSGSSSRSSGGGGGGYLLLPRWRWRREQWRRWRRAARLHHHRRHHLPHHLAVVRHYRAKAERASIDGVLVDSLPPPTRYDEIERWQQDDSEIEAGLNDIRQRDPPSIRRTSLIASRRRTTSSIWRGSRAISRLPSPSSARARRTA